MAGPGNILIKVGADAGQAVRELSTVDNALSSTMTSSEKMGAGLKKAALPAAAALTGIAVAAKGAIDDAADLNEQMNKSSAVFGKSSADINKWSSGLTKDFGLSQEAALEATGTFGNMLVPMGFAQDEAASMSKQMVELAGDMASFNNASPEETLAALSSGLAGESEPLRKYGVLLNDARLKQEAMNQGTYSGTGALDAQAKAAATMALILKDTTAAQGDFAETSGSAANQARIQEAEMANLSAELGQALLPAYQAIQGIMIQVVGLLSEHTGAVKVLTGIIAALAAGILIANVAMKAYAAASVIVRVATAAWTAAQWLLNAALSANPIGLVIVAIAALAAGLIIAYKKSETFREIVAAAMGAVKTAASAVADAFSALLGAAKTAFNWIVDHWKIGLFALGPIGVAIRLLIDNFDSVKAAGETAFNAIKAVIDAVAGAIDAVIGAVDRLIGMISRIKIPKLPDLNPFSLAAPAPAAAGARAAPSSFSSTPGIVINVTGAIDPEGTARAIERVLRGHARRQGRP